MKLLFNLDILKFKHNFISTPIPRFATIIGSEKIRRKRNVAIRNKLLYENVLKYERFVPILNKEAFYPKMATKSY